MALFSLALTRLKDKPDFGPPPGVLTNSARPPDSARRPRMLPRPFPFETGSSGSKPRPLSSTSSHTSAEWMRSLTQSSVAPECLSALFKASR